MNDNARPTDRRRAFGGRCVVALLGALMVGLLAACSATGGRYPGFRPTTQDSTQIVLYRPDLFRAGGAVVAVFLDDQNVGSLRNGGWLSIAAKPGPHTVKIDEKFEFGRTASITVTTRSEAATVIRVLPGGMNSLFLLPAGPVATFGKWSLVEMSAEAAALEMKDLKESR